uniref:Uncharacterized protein n=1 Tax=Oryza sativa subsp. japonica TaxID=39947 RepID=Q6Z7H9_ORYSJ|nr:unknown protein [Oryza sativa Japonica Group]
MGVAGAQWAWWRVGRRPAAGGQKATAGGGRHRPRSPLGAAPAPRAVVLQLYACHGHHGHGGARGSVGSVVVHLLAWSSSSSMRALADTVSTTSSALSSSATSPSRARRRRCSRLRFSVHIMKKVCSLLELHYPLTSSEYETQVI